MRKAFIYFFVLGVCLLLPFAGFAQDSTRILFYNEFIENIFSYHPIAQKAELNLEKGRAELLSAKGALDPVVNAGWDQKQFDGKEYYNKYGVKLKIPTPIGVSVVGGYDKAEGYYLNPENTTGEDGLWNVGVEVDVLQGVLNNERRISIKQAEVFNAMSVLERRLLLQDLVFDATQAYLIWQQYEAIRQVLDENIRIAEEYKQHTVQSYLQGEKTTMDTLEAATLLQDAISWQQKNSMGLSKARQMLENFLWFEGSPVALQEATTPDDYTRHFVHVNNLSSVDLSGHPLLLSTENKITYYELEQKLKRDKLKPKLKVKYNPLINAGGDDAGFYPTDNYKLGLEFSTPILWRTERGEIDKGEIKIQEYELELLNKTNELNNKIENSSIQLQLKQAQYELMQQNVASYKTLMENENEKFRYGESSVFLYIKRQEKYITGQLKLIEIQIDYQMELLTYLYLTNQLI